MKNFYNEKTANYPRLSTDKFFSDYENEFKYEGFMDGTFLFLEENQYLDRELWARFVEQFRHDSDFDTGWRGEFWGKSMRGAAFCYAYSKNEELYDILTETVKDIMTTPDESGRISSYGENHEFTSWDMWGRKYVLLGMQYYLEICKDESLKEEIIKCMRGQADYILDHIGYTKDGKLHISKTSNIYRAVNSASILEPMVRLYSLTGEQKYLDFAKYIVETGTVDIQNLFKSAYDDKLMPYQYPVTKSYEMTSCFVGLLEYYRIVGEEWHKTAVVNFANRILENDFTVVGGSGCSEELFDHSTVRQANPDVHIAQENCVTVTIMQLLYQVYLLTGETKYIDAFEKSFYNAYLGAFNTEHIVNPIMLKAYPDAVPEAFPYDSYSPLTAGVRGVSIGGLRKMSDNHCYGCCACIGGYGSGLLPKLHIVSDNDGFAMNFYIGGSVKTFTEKQAVTFVTETEYPKFGEVKITLNLEEKERFVLKLRNPAWNKKTTLTLNGKKVKITDGYIVIDKEWENGDTIIFTLDMRTRAEYPIPYGKELLINRICWGGYNHMAPTLDIEHPDTKNHIALLRGPITLAQDSRIGYSVDDPIGVKVDRKGFVKIKLPEKDTVSFDHIVEAQIPLKNGKYMTVIDYASAGKLWSEESKIAAWMKTK